MTKSRPQAIHVHNDDFERPARFTRVRQEILDDLDLQTTAPLAFIILVHLLSKPPWWEINTEYFIKRGFGGQNQVRAAFRELQARGYMTSRKNLQDGRFVGVTYEVYGVPLPKATGAPMQCAGQEPENPIDAPDPGKTAGQAQRTETVREVLTTETPLGSQSRSINDRERSADTSTRTTAHPGLPRKQPRIIPRRANWVHPYALEVADLDKREAYMQTQAHVKWIYSADGMPVSNRDALLMGDG